MRVRMRELDASFWRKMEKCRRHTEKAEQLCKAIEMWHIHKNDLEQLQ